MRIGQLDIFWQIFQAKYKFGHIFDQKNLKILVNVKKGGHSVRNCQKLVVNYSKMESLGESKAKKGVNR